MKVLQIVPEMRIGGVETGTLDLARELVRRGHQAYVVSAGGPLVRALEECGARHIQLPVHQKSLLQIWRLSRVIRKIVREEKIDILHARSRVPAWIGFVAVRGTRARFVTTAHGYYRPHWGSLAITWGERVIAISQAIRDHLLKNFHVFPDRIRLIHRGVNLKAFHFRPKRINSNSVRIGMIGRITPLKGHEYFLKAMQEVIQVFPRARGWVVGDAPPSKDSYLRRLLRLRDELGLNASVDFVSGTAAVSEAMEKLDVLVLATTTPEAFGRVVIEAQASGVPVVATRVGGVSEIIDDGVNGWLVPPRDPEALAGAIIRAIKDPDQTSKVVQEARRKVEEKFGLELMVEKTLEVYHELLKSPKILVVKLSALGDIILASPSLRALREAYPQSEISILTQRPYLDLVRDCPYLDVKIGVFPAPHRRLRGFLRWVHEIRVRRFDKLIDLQNNKKSHLLGFLSRVPVRLGYARGGRGIFLTHKIRYNAGVGPVESQNWLLNLLGVSIKDQRLEIWPSQVQAQYIQGFLEREGIRPDDALVALFPFSNARWGTKRWGLEKFVELARRVHHELDAIPVFVGGEGDRVLSQDLKTLNGVPYLDWIGRTDIGQLAELFKRCRVLVSGDSSPLHVGSASGVPTIALFGPTDPARHIPPGSVKVLTHPVPCSPCYSPTCKIKTHDCMEGITVDEVFQEIKKILGKGA